MHEPTEDIFCPKCGYNLYGIPEFRCPECGFRYDHEAIRSLARSNAATKIITGQVVVVRLAFAVMFIAAGLMHHLRSALLLPYVIVISLLWIAIIIRWRIQGLGLVPDCDRRYAATFVILISFVIAHTSILLPRCSLGIALALTSSAWFTAICGFQRSGFAPLSIRPMLRRRAVRWNVIAVLSLVLVSLSFALYFV